VISANMKNSVEHGGEETVWSLQQQSRVQYPKLRLCI
jgi:hypothetical protein